MIQRKELFPIDIDGGELQEVDKNRAFRLLLSQGETSFLMEAHNGVSAKIVEEVGFKGIWASGLGISTAFGLRDRNEASWTQVLDVVEFMSEATRIPILVDADTGFGDFNNFRRFVSKAEQRGISAVCIEDKIFPKTNSFVDVDQELADVDEFCGKIKAGKDAQSSSNFSIIARTETLIVGRSLDEALDRAEAYRAAGADAILIHSKKSEASEVLEFARQWGRRSPLIVVPTTYHATPTHEFEKAQIAMVIWANHNVRASIASMRAISEKIFREKSVSSVEGSIASVAEIFDLTNINELLDAERRYLNGASSART